LTHEKGVYFYEKEMLKGKNMGDYRAYGEIQLGDKTLSARVEKTLIQLSSAPEASVSGACKNPHQAKAVYRLLSNDKFTARGVLGISKSETIERIRKSGVGTVLIPQDTTVLNYTGLKETEGLGLIGSDKNSKGLIMHSALAVGEDGQIFGLLAEKIWSRPEEDSGKKKLRKKLPIEEKESYKWLETLEAADISSDLNNVKVIHICDREGDLYELFCKAHIDGKKYLLRRIHDRIVQKEGNKEGYLLNAFIENLPVSGYMKVNVPRDSHTDREARVAELEIKYGKSRIKKPSNLKESAHTPEFVDVCIVSAKEINAPAEVKKPISWQLVTNDEICTIEEAITGVNRYAQRWKIEIFHYTLKSGCTIEKLRESTAEKLIKLIALYSVIALQIMILTHMARIEPESSCETEFQTEEWSVLYKVVKKTKKAPEKPPTILEAVVMLAKLGGFLARKSDGFPGVKVLWRGLIAFNHIFEASLYLS
jgi:hypothetical protein